MTCFDYLITLHDGDVFRFICFFVRLSLSKFAKSFTTWQHLAASGGLSYRLQYTCSIVFSKHRRNISVVYLPCSPAHFSMSYYMSSSKYKKLSCRRETARCFGSLIISLSHSRSLKVTRNDILE